MSLPGTNSHWNSLPNELQYMILSNFTDLTTLLNMIKAYPPMTHLFVYRHQEIFANIIQNIPCRLESKAVTAILNLKHLKTSGRDPELLPLDLYSLACTFLNEELNPCVVPRMAEPLAALENVANVYGDIEHWTQVLIQSCCRLRAIKMNAIEATWNENRPTSLDPRCIRRALWRFWIFHEFATGIALPGETKRESINRSAFQIFIEDFTLWDIEEFEFVFCFFQQTYQEFISHSDASVSPAIRIPIRLQRLLSILGFEPNAPLPEDIGKWHQRSPPLDRWAEIIFNASNTRDVVARRNLWRQLPNEDQLYWRR